MEPLGVIEFNVAANLASCILKVNHGIFCQAFFRNGPVKTLNFPVTLKGS